MKGLLIKDLELLKVQKQFFFMLIVVMASFTFFYEDTSFILFFLTFSVSLLSVTTISYDEMDNGSAFLFTLPVSRRLYVVEKYVLAVLLGGGAWVFSTLWLCAGGLIKGTTAVPEQLLSAVLLLPLLLCVQAFMIPFQLKFGGERARIAIIIAIALLTCAGMAAVKVAEALGADIENVPDRLPAEGMGAATAFAFAAAVLLLLLSVRIGISIMEKKEF
ncbi:MAG: ABC-2 transporter permease [Eubacteriales bacterium]|nr:ABC-2 transporter permease [Eubacteriales bacterium]